MPGAQSRTTILKHITHVLFRMHSISDNIYLQAFALKRASQCCLQVFYTAPRSSLVSRKTVLMAVAHAGSRPVFIQLGKRQPVSTLGRQQRPSPANKGGDSSRCRCLPEAPTDRLHRSVPDSLALPLRPPLRQQAVQPRERA